MREWRLLFSIDVNGTSMQTFYRCVHERDNTVLLIQNEKGEAFGSYQVEAWHDSFRFYGSGDGSFLFSMELSEEKGKSQKMSTNINVYDPNYSNN